MYHLMWETVIWKLVFLSNCSILIKPFDTQKQQSPFSPHFWAYSESLMDTFSKCQTSLLDILYQNHYKVTRRFKIIKPDQRKLLSDKKYINRQYRIGAVCLMKDTIPAATLSTCHSTDMMFIKNICRNVFIYQNCQLYRKLFIKTNPDIFFTFSTSSHKYLSLLIQDITVS